MGLNLKIAPKKVYWTKACIICPQDYEEIQESHFEVQFERFTRTEIELFDKEQQAISQHAGLRMVRKLASSGKQAKDAAAVLEATYADIVEQLGDDFDPGVDFAMRWLGRKMKSIRGLELADGGEVTIDDLPELLDIVSYRVGLINLLRQQLEDPNAADRKN